MHRQSKGLILTFCTLLALAACGDDGPSGPGLEDDTSAAIEGRVEQTSSAQAAGSALRAPSSSSSSSSGAQNADRVAVGRVMADGSFSALAEADVQADGSFRIDGVQTGQEDLVVTAYVSGQAAGSVLVHERTSMNTTIKTAPINHQTTVEARTYASMRARGETDASTDSELSLFLRMDAATAQTVVSSSTEMQTVTDAYIRARASMNRVFADAGTTLDAGVRGSLMANAAATFAAAVHAGASADVAYDAFASAALSAYTQAGATAEATVMATAAAATTLDANLVSSARGQIVSETVRLNLRAREQFAASFASSTHSTLALEIQNSLASGRTTLLSASSATEIRASMQASLTATADVVVANVLNILAPNAGLIIRSEVQAKTEAALNAAALGVRLDGAASADAVAQALVSYRADVRAAVDAMIAASGSTTADASVMTSLFIAAQGGANIH